MSATPGGLVMRHATMILLSLVACTSSQPSPADSSQASNFGQAAVTASNTVTQYQQAATSAETQAECTAALRQYEAAMQPLLDRMRSTAGRLDDYMKSGGNAMAGDMACGIQVMADELAHHETVACMSTDMTVNRAEAQRDAEAMLSFANHMVMRAMQAGETMGPGQMTDAGWMIGWGDGGWTMPDGGMIDPGQAMPGCAYADGGYQVPDAGYWMDGGPGSTDGGSGGPMMDGGQ